MEIVLCSIPYTGTNFTAQLFTAKGFEHLANNDRPQGNSIYVSHMIKETQISRALDLAKTRPLVVPLRHPFRVEAAFTRQGWPLQDMLTAYRTLCNRFLPLDPYIMPVDSEAREQRLQALSEGLGIDLKTDWKVVASKSGTYSQTLDQFTPSPDVQALTEELNGFLKAFY